MSPGIQVHDYDTALSRQEQILKEADMLPANKKTIQKFVNFCKSSEEVGTARTIKYIYTLRKIADLSEKPFKKMNEEDIIDILAKLGDHRTAKGEPYSKHSMNDFRKAISKFWRWLYFDEYQGEAPPQIRRLKLHFKRQNSEPTIFSKDEIGKIINTATTIRDKAFFSCLYDLQARVSELLSRQIKHVRYTEGGDIQILIESTKAGKSHWETLFESVSLFTTWMRLHPKRNDPNAPLWVTLRKNENIVPLRYETIRKTFLNICRRQGIREGKRCTIHMLRKSKATHDLADGVPLTYIESRGSWSKGSKALHDCYLAVQQKDKDNAYRKKYGMSSNGHSEAIELKRCSRCESVINGDKFCPRCGLPVDMKTASEVDKLDVAKLIDKDLLSELVKRQVLQEMRKIVSK